jgi:hypothetical protein
MVACEVMIWKEIMNFSPFEIRLSQNLHKRQLLSVKNSEGHMLDSRPGGRPY